MIIRATVRVRYAGDIRVQFAVIVWTPQGAGCLILQGFPCLWNPVSSSHHQQGTMGGLSLITGDCHPGLHTGTPPEWDRPLAMRAALTSPSSGTLQRLPQVGVLQLPTGLGTSVKSPPTHLLWSLRDPIKSLPTLGFVEPEQHCLPILFPRLAPLVSPSSWDSPSVLGQNRKGVKKDTCGSVCRVAGQEPASMTTQGRLAPRTTAPLRREQWVGLALCLPPEDNHVSLILIITLSVSSPNFPEKGWGKARE